MADTWDKIFRQVAHRANLLAVADSAALAAAYVDTDIGQAQLTNKASEFPKDGIDDAILNAADKMLAVIGGDPKSRYRPFFSGVTGNITNGSLIPLVSSGGVSRVGVIGAVRDSVTNAKLKFRDYSAVVNVSSITLAQSIFWFYTDNIRLWHSRTNVIADIVIWNKAEQRVLMNSSPNRGACPFPEDLHEGLVCGGLSYVFRNNFNIEQVDKWAKRFNETLALCGQNHEAHILQREITD